MPRSHLRRSQHFLQHKVKNNLKTNHKPKTLLHFNSLESSTVQLQKVWSISTMKICKLITILRWLMQVILVENNASHPQFTKQYVNKMS